jgi:murein DD-endopeptidase MepM/ murein hydrolase activator NlpD
VVPGFSPPADPWGAGHRGVDLLGRVGEPVHSSRAGTVTYVGTIAGVGVVVVRHGTTRTTYQPVHASVHVGQHVEAGQVLGTLTLAGSHCFPSACLHWGLLDGDRYLDPLTRVGAAPVRLLPLP